MNHPLRWFSVCAYNVLIRRPELINNRDIGQWTGVPFSMNMARKSLLAGILNRFGYVKGYDGMGSFFGASAGESRRDMNLNKGWVYAAVKAISEAMAGTEFILYQKEKNGAVKEVHEHPILDLLDGINQSMTGYEMKYLFGSHLELTGNAYLLLINESGLPVVSDQEIPAAMYPLSPDRVRLDRLPPPQFIKRYIYTEANSASQIAYQPWQILHLKYPNPNDPMIGLSPVEALRSWIETEENASDFQRVFFINGSKIGGILESDNNLPPAKVEQLRAQWHEAYQGLRNMHKPVILPKGLKYVDNTKSQQEMDFINSLNELRDKILAGLRVPKTILGNAEGSTNRATAETAEYVFAMHTMKPKMKLICAYLNEFLIPRFGENLFLGFRDPVPENKDVEMLEMRYAMGGQPILTVNEARNRYMNEDPIKGGDAIYGPVQNVPQLVKPAETEVQASIREGIEKKTKRVESSGKPFRTRASRNMEKRQKFAKTLASDAVRAAVDKITIKKITDLTDEEYQGVWEAKVSRVGQFEKLQVDVIKKINAQQKKEVMRNLPKIVKAVDPKTLIADSQQYVKLIVDGSIPIQTTLFVQEGGEALKLIGASQIDLITPEVQTAINDAVAKMAGSYTDTTLNLLQSTLEEGIANGMGLADLGNLVSSLYDFSDSSRADLLARTEMTRVSNDAKVTAWDQTGIVGKKTWYTAEDERVCPTCQAMHGKTIDLNANFFNEGDTIEGIDGSVATADYGDIAGPPLHPNCRCDLRPDDVGY